MRCLFDRGANSIDIDGLTRLDRMPQRVLHRVLAFAGRKSQDCQVFADRDLRAVGFTQHVISDSKVARGEHVLAILVVLECSRLTHQRIDHMAIVDRRSADSGQPWHPLNRVAVVRDIDPFGVDRHIDFLTDQPTRNGVAVATNLDRTAAANANAAKRFMEVDLAIGQRTELLQLHRKAVGSCQITFGNHPFNKRHVAIATFEATTAAKHQGLIDRVLDVAVGRFDVTVLVGATRVGLLRLDVVMLHQRLIPRRELLLRGVVVDRGAKRVGAMQLGHASELPEGFLHAFAECFERFRKTEGHGLHIGIRQHAMEERVIELRSGDLDAERIHHGEVAGRYMTWVMFLWKGDGLVRAMSASPKPHASLEGSAGRVEELSGVAILQPRKEGHCLQFGLRFEPLLNLGPDLGEGVNACAIPLR